MTNEIITALNDLYGENTFIFQYGIQDEPYRRIIILQVLYTKTGAVLLQTTNVVNNMKPITPEQGDAFIREFNKNLMKNVLYSIETQGKVVDPRTGRPVATFADIKQQLKTNDNANTTVHERGHEQSIQRPNNGADDGTEGIPIERLPRPDNFWN